MQFENLNISKPVLRALLEEGYTKPSPIQTESIPPLLEGYDLLGCAQTGTGKTAAFAVPILDALSFAQRSSPARKEIKALILAPTRELAIQIGESFDTYGKYLSLKTAVIFGGVSQYPQTKALASGIPGARLRTLPGIGHELPKESFRGIIEEVTQLAKVAARDAD